MDLSGGEFSPNVDSSLARPRPLRSEVHAPNLPAPENKRFYPALDGLRALAVLMVFYHHYLGFRFPALSWGWTGVNFFFVLSGFLITGILYDTRDATHRFQNFYVRRTLRIFPLYYSVLLVALLLHPFLQWIWHPAWLLTPLYLSNYARFIWLSDFLKGNGTIEHLRSSLPFRMPMFMFLGHFWSLCVEEQFYLVWPMVVFFVRDRVKLRNICVIVCLSALTARIVCLYIVPQQYLNAELLLRLTPFRADDLLLGGLFALMLRGPEAQWLKRIRYPAFYVFITCFIAFEAIYRIHLHHFYSPNLTAPFLTTIGLTLIGIFAALVILLSLEPTGILYRFFTLKPLRRLGQISYGFYVFHDIPHTWYSLFVTRAFGSAWHLPYLVAAVAFAGTLILSSLSFRYFESPFLRLKDRFTVLEPALGADRDNSA